MADLLARFLPDSLGNGPQRTAFLVLAGSVSLVLVSIAASQILLAAAVTLAFWLRRRQNGTSWSWPPIVLPLACFFVWTVVTALASSDPKTGLGITKKFFLFLVLFLIPWFLKGYGRILWVYRATFAVAFVAATIGILQYLTNPNRDLLHRISGPMSQWMTFSGLLMLVLVSLSAYAMCIGLGKAAWVLPLGIVLIVSLALSLTRNAWLGAIAGLITVLTLARPRALGGLITVILLLLLISPGKIQDRLRTGLDPTDANTRNRIELFGTSLRLIKDNPWFGVGPKNVSRAALRYRGTDEFPDWMYQHMHSNFLQIAAERGLPGLVLWLWFIGRLAWDSWRVRRSVLEGAASGGGRSEPNESLFASTAALGCCAALLVSGLFEYNFGDSEVLTLFLFIMGAPYAFQTDAPAAPRRKARQQKTGSG